MPAEAPGPGSEATPDVLGPGVRDSDAEASPLAKWDYDPPKVSYDPIVQDGRTVGFHTNPPFGRDWPHIQTLQHFAALIEHRTGIKVRVAKADTPGEGFEVMTRHSLGGPAPFQATHAWLSGFQNGVHEVLASSSQEMAKR